MISLWLLLISLTAIHAVPPIPAIPAIVQPIPAIVPGVVPAIVAAIVPDKKPAIDEATPSLNIANEAKPSLNIANASLNAAYDCQGSIDRIDECGKKLFIYGDRDFVYPRTVAEVTNDHCPVVQNAEKCVRDYTRNCLKPFPRQIIGMIVRGSAQQNKKRCDSEAGKLEYIQYEPCLSKIMERPHTCMDKYIASLEAIRDQIENLDYKMPSVCCNFHKFKQCIADQTSTYCSKKAAIDYVIGQIADTAEDVLDLTCKNYEEGSPNCDKLPKLKPKSAPEAKSAIPALVEIYTNL